MLKRAGELVDERDKTNRSCCRERSRAEKRHVRDGHLGAELYCFSYAVFLRLGPFTDITEKACTSGPAISRRRGVDGRAGFGILSAFGAFKSKVKYPPGCYGGGPSATYSAPSSPRPLYYAPPVPRREIAARGTCLPPGRKPRSRPLRTDSAIDGGGALSGLSKSASSSSLSFDGVVSPTV